MFSDKLYLSAKHGLPASPRSREKSLGGCVILTGFFDFKYSLFLRWLSDISKQGPQKIDQQKKNFSTFFLEVFANLAHVSAWPYDQQGNV